MVGIRWHRAIGAILCVVALVGCGPTSAQPKPPTPAPTTPTIPIPATTPVPPPATTPPPPPDVQAHARVDFPCCLTESTAGPLQANVDTAEVIVTFHLPKGTREDAARTALTVQAPSPPKVTFAAYPLSSDLQLTFPAGQPGETLTARVHGPFGPDGQAIDLGYELHRTAIGLHWDLQQPDGTWAAVVPGATVPRAPLTLRLRIQGPVQRNPLRNFLAIALGKAGEPGRPRRAAAAPGLSAPVHR